MRTDLAYDHCDLSSGACTVLDPDPDMWGQSHLDLIQRLRQIRPHILHVLHTNAEADQVLLDPDLCALLRPEAPVRLHSGHLDQALHATQRRGDVRDLDGVDELGGRPVKRAGGRRIEGGPRGTGRRQRT